MDPQDIANALTLCLGAATVWLGAETRRMAKATKDSVELQSRAYLAIHSLEHAIGKANNLAAGREQQAIRLSLILQNAGQVLIQYEVETIAVTFEGADFGDIAFETRGGPIHPRAQATFRLPWFFPPGPPRAAQGGEMRFRINFWSSPVRISHVTCRLRYTLQGTDVSRIEWLYLEGPAYA